MDRSSKQNINKDILVLNDAQQQMDLTDVNRTFHPKDAKYTFISNAHGTFSKTTWEDTKQASTNSRKLKSHQASSRKKLKNIQIHGH